MSTPRTSRARGSTRAAARDAERVHGRRPRTRAPRSEHGGDDAPPPMWPRRIRSSRGRSRRRLPIAESHARPGVRRSAPRAAGTSQADAVNTAGDAARRPGGLPAVPARPLDAAAVAEPVAGGDPLVRRPAAHDASGSVEQPGDHRATRTQRPVARRGRRAPREQRERGRSRSGATRQHPRAGCRPPPADAQSSVRAWATVRRPGPQRRPRAGVDVRRPADHVAVGHDGRRPRRPPRRAGRRRTGGRAPAGSPRRAAPRPSACASGRSVTTTSAPDASPAPRTTHAADAPRGQRPDDGPPVRRQVEQHPRPRARRRTPRRAGSSSCSPSSPARRRTARRARRRRRTR